MKKTYKSPEVEIFEFDAEVQMEAGESHLPKGPYGPDLVPPEMWHDSVDPGILGPDSELLP